MYIYLSDDLLNIDFNNDIDSLKKIIYLLDTHIAGHNVIHASTELLNKIQNNKEINSLYQRQIKVIRNHIRMTKNIWDKSENLYKIFITNKSSIQKELNNKRLYVPIQYLNSVNSLVETLLIAEDMSDCELLEHAIQHYADISATELKGFTYKINLISGGGGSIEKIANTNIKKNNQFIIVFTDSDKFHPSCKGGDNSQACQKLQDSDQNLCLHFSTVGRELENDLPLSFVTQSYKSDSNIINNIDFYKINEEGKRYYLYADLKNGVTQKWLQEHKQNKDFKNFWINLITKNKELTSITEKMASKTLNWLNYELKPNVPSNDEIMALANDPNAQTWLTHGKTLFWLSIAPKKTRL